MDQDDNRLDGSGLRPWNPLEQIPKSIVEKYGSKEILPTQPDGLEDDMGAVEVWDVGSIGYICQVHCCSDGRIFIFHSNTITATQCHVAPDVNVFVGSANVKFYW